MPCYCLLGLAIGENQDAESYVEVITPNGYRLSWNTEAMIRRIDPSWTPPSGNARVSLAFKCDSPAEVDAAYRKLIDRGLGTSHTEPWDALWGQRYAVVNDPDGNAVDLFAPL